MSGSIRYWVILIAANLPLFVFFARVICGGVEEWRGRWWYWLVPNIGLFDRRYDEAYSVTDEDDIDDSLGDLFDLTGEGSSSSSSMLSWRFSWWAAACVVVIVVEHLLLQRYVF